mgnify:CR=1 FL=1|tara:strand:+ start:682 stop:1065 length:384 start_codon:yes stop_codon:yes gene_type:complete
MNNLINIFSIFILVLVLSCRSATPATPIKVDRYTVVIIEETEARQFLPPSQLSAINSRVWRDYVSDHNGQWRVLDPHTDVSKDEDWVRESLKADRSSLPWLIFSNKKTGGSMPMPENLEQLMEKIKQ